MKNIVLDYDGTIHDCIKIYSPAFRLAYKHLVLEGLAPNRAWEDKEISQWLGFSTKDMWNSFMPHLSQHEKDTCSKIIGDNMFSLIHKGEAKLYPNALLTLAKLNKSGYNLIFLSNCKRRYMQTHINYFGLDKYFLGFYCTEDFNFAPKYSIFNAIKTKYNGDFIMVGDRFSDMEVAQKHGLKSIGCAYGYGNASELDSATKIIGKIDDLPKAIESITY